MSVITMKLIIFLSLVALAVCNETYSTENDNIDIEAVVSNNNTLLSFYECFVDKKPCDAVGADFKKDLPEVFKTACSKCTSTQKYILTRFLEELKKKFPVELEVFKKKYEPDTTEI